MEVLSSFFVDLVESLARFWPLLTVIGGFLGVVAASAVMPILSDDSSFKQIRDWAFKPGLAARYRDLVATGLNAAARFYGPARCLSWRGYGVCLLVALVYPLFLWQLAWSLEGPGTLAGASAFDETTPGPRRRFGLLLLWVPLFAIGLVYIGFPRLQGFLDRHLMRSRRRIGWVRTFSQTPVPAHLAGLMAVGAGMFVVAVAGNTFLAGVWGVAAVAGVAGVAGVVAVAVIVVVAVGTVVAGGTGGAGARAVVGIAVVAVAAAFAVVAGDAVVYLTFMLIIPVANAVLDHVSVQVSRWLLSDLVARRSAAWQRLMVLGHIMADVIAAGLFLVILAVLLPTVLQLANRALDGLGWPLVEWGLYLDAARREPFGAGLLVTGMLATTLIPTVLHLLAAGGALAVPQIGGTTIKMLAEKAKPTLLDRVVFVALIALSVILSWAVLVVMSVALWQATGAFLGPLGRQLADLAEGVGRAIGGPVALGS